MEDKQFWQSMTFWGALLLAIEGFLLASPVSASGWTQAVITGLGIVFSIFGIRRKMSEMSME